MVSYNRWDDHIYNIRYPNLELVLFKATSLIGKSIYNLDNWNGVGVWLFFIYIIYANAIITLSFHPTPVGLFAANHVENECKLGPSPFLFLFSVNMTTWMLVLYAKLLNIFKLWHFLISPTPTGPIHLGPRFTCNFLKLTALLHLVYT